MSTAEAMWLKYASSWKAEGEAEKRAIFEQTLSPDCVYLDPLQRCEGWEALLGYMTAFHAQIPGGHFVTKEFHSHSSKGAARWELQGADGQVLGVGMSMVEFGEDGRLRSMTGFFDTP